MSGPISNFLHEDWKVEAAFPRLNSMDLRTRRLLSFHCQKIAADLIREKISDPRFNDFPEAKAMVEAGYNAILSVVINHVLDVGDEPGSVN